jgi:GTP-binding protein
MLDWAVPAGMPMHILLTKADKLTYGAAKNTLLKVQSEIRKGWGDVAIQQLFSAPKRMGLEEAQMVLPAGWACWKRKRWKTPACSAELSQAQKTPDFVWGGEVRGSSPDR